MTEHEKRKLAVRRELEALARVADNFAQLARAAEAETVELKLAFARLNKLAQEDAIDRAIDDLDYRMKRGRYSYLRQQCRTPGCSHLVGCASHYDDPCDCAALRGAS